jgi:hypothetical protein
MKTTCETIILLVIGQLTIGAVFGQGTFQNLNFESPIAPLIVSPNSGTVPFANAFPGWVGYEGTNQATRARFAGVNLDNATLALLTNTIFSAPLIEGNYTAVLQAGRNPVISGTPLLVSASLAQTGLVPADSQSLLFKAFTAGTAFAVSLAGVNIPVYTLETFPTYTLYGGDISAFANSVAELRFTAFPNNYPGSTVFALDSIQFSNQPIIPEPSTLSLFGLGALLLGWRFGRGGLTARTSPTPPTPRSP